MYEEFRQQWFANLSEDVQRERASAYPLDIEAELESMCREEYDRQTRGMDGWFALDQLG